MGDKEIQKQAEEMVDRIEKGDTSNLSDQLNAMPMQERLELVRQMDKINAEHRASNPLLPDIQFETNKDAGGTEHLQDINIQQYKQVERSYLNPMRYIDGPTRIDEGKKTDVYDAPLSRAGNGLLQQAADGILSARAREREILESMNK